MNLDILGVVGFENPRMGLVKMDEDLHNLDFDTGTLLFGAASRSQLGCGATSEQN